MLFSYSCVVTGLVHVSVTKTVMGAVASSEDTFVHGPNIKLSSIELLAERIKSWDGGVVYGTKILRGATEFEVEITSYSGVWRGTLKMGVLQRKAGSRIKHSDIPQYYYLITNCCMYSSDQIVNRLVGYSGPTNMKCSTNLENLREGDRLGLRVSHDGVLTFFVNGKSQGVAVQGVYQDGYDLYPVVDVYGQCEAVRITRAGMFTHLRSILA